MGPSCNPSSYKLFHCFEWVTQKYSKMRCFNHCLCLVKLHCINYLKRYTWKQINSLSYFIALWKKGWKRWSTCSWIHFERNIVQTGKTLFKASTAKHILPGIMFLPNTTQIIYFYFGDRHNETERSLSSTILLLIRP